MRELIDHVVPERPRLENAPLKAVVCQARFPRQLGLGDDDVRPIQRALSHRYPMVADDFAAGAGHQILRFSDAQDDWVAIVSPDAISLETTAYVGMKDLLIRWSEFAGAVAEALELTVQTRLGLRYINELECPASPRDDLSGWIRKELLSPLTTRPDAEGLQRFVSQAQFQQPDGSSCNMRHGVAPQQSEGGQMIFLLDLDCFVGGAAEFDPAQQIHSFARLNESAYSYFRWAFSERTLESFGPERRDVPKAEWGVVRDRESAWSDVHYLVGDAAELDYTSIYHGYLDGCGLCGSERERQRRTLPGLPFDVEPRSAPSPEPLAKVLEAMRESIDISVADLARMVGLRRRQFYNLLAGNPTTTETEMRIRRLAAGLERLSEATGGGPAALRAAVLTPIGPDATNLFEVAVGGEEEALGATVEALLAQVEAHGVRRTRRAIPRPASAAVAEQRRKRLRESLADRPAHEPVRKGDGDGRK